MARTHKAARITLEKMQKKVDDWNAAHPVGVSVMVKLDGKDEPQPSKTTTPAQMLSGHSPVIWLENVSGCYHMSHIRAAHTPEEQISAAKELKRTLGYGV